VKQLFSGDHARVLESEDAHVLESEDAHVLESEDAHVLESEDELPPNRHVGADPWHALDDFDDETENSGTNSDEG
jgi:hypothetical protein